MSSPMSLPTIPVLVVNPHVIFNIVSSSRSPHPLVPGNRSHAISSPIYPFRMGMILSLSSSIASRRCVISLPASKPPTRPSLHICFLIMSFAYTASPNPSSPTMDRSSRLIFGNLLHPWWIWSVDYLLLSTPRLMVKLNVWTKPSNNISASIAIIKRTIGRISCLSRITTMRISPRSIVLLSTQIMVFILSSRSISVPLLHLFPLPKLSQRPSSPITLTWSRVSSPRKITKLAIMTPSTSVLSSLLAIKFGSPSLNISTQCLSKKLDWKHLGPFTITEQIGTQAYRLQLPASMKIHSMFHVSLLEPYHPSMIPDRVRPPPPPIVVESQSEYEVEEILDFKYLRKRLFYLIKWKGYDPSNNSWEPASFVKNAPHLVEAFHAKYPCRPKPTISI